MSTGTENQAVSKLASAPEAQRCKPLPRHLRDWRRANSGISVDAGPTRVRLEAAGTRDQRIDIARMIAAAPDLYEALSTVLRHRQVNRSTFRLARADRADITRALAYIENLDAMTGQLEDALAKAVDG
jgi:hypothetical protein